MAQQLLTDEDGDPLSVSEGLRRAAKASLLFLEDAISKATAQMNVQPEAWKAAYKVQIEKMEKVRDETQKALDSATGPLDWEKCPHCASEDIVGGSPELEHGDYYQDMSCQSCAGTWGEWYRCDERVIYNVKFCACNAELASDQEKRTGVCIKCI